MPNIWIWNAIVFGDPLEYMDGICQYPGEIIWICISSASKKKYRLIELHRNNSHWRK
jgi:hypothetical protein